MSACVFVCWCWTHVLWCLVSDRGDLSLRQGFVCSPEGWSSSQAVIAGCCCEGCKTAITSKPTRNKATMATRLRKARRCRVMGGGVGQMRQRGDHQWLRSPPRSTASSPVHIQGWGGGRAEGCSLSTCCCNSLQMPCPPTRLLLAPDCAGRRDDWPPLGPRARWRR